MEHIVPFSKKYIMVVTAYQPEIAANDVGSDAVWNDICLFLTPLVKDWVCRFNVTCWRGQESDIVLDIVQETLGKTFKYALEAQHQDITITSLKRLSIVIAKNLLHDLLHGGDHSLLIGFDVTSPEMEMIAFGEGDDLVYYRSVWIVVNSVLGGGNWLLKNAKKDSIPSDNGASNQHASAVSSSYVVGQLAVKPYWPCPMVGRVC